MIPKGNQRAGGQELATHLLNAYDNERVEVAEVRGAIAQDLHGAFAEWYAEAKATKCSKYLYSLSINPDHTQGPFTREHYYDFIRRTEESLGLSDQPRAVVFHVKHGREHCHVVWSRIDTEKMKAVQLSHDRQKLRAVAQEYARDHNLTLPPGMQNNRGKDRFPDHAKTENLAEKQQEERTGTSKKQRMEQITKAWRESSDARAFVKALEDERLLSGARRQAVLCRRGPLRRSSQPFAPAHRRKIKGTQGPPRRLSASTSCRRRRRAGPRPRAAAGSPAKRTAATCPRGTLEQARQAQATARAAPRRPAPRPRLSGGRILRPNASSSPNATAPNARRLPTCKTPATPTLPATAPQNSPKAFWPFLPASRASTPSPPSARSRRTSKGPWNNACKPPRSPAVTGAKWRISSTRSAASTQPRQARAPLPRNRAAPRRVPRHSRPGEDQAGCFGADTRATGESRKVEANG